MAGCTQPQTAVPTPKPTTAIPTPVQTTIIQPSGTVPVVVSSTTAASISATNTTGINTTGTIKTPATAATTKPPTTVDYSSDSSDSSTPAPDPTVVKTDAGYISGLQQNGLRVYLGIPFAAPPTGELRWRPPAPVTPWDGVKDAKAFSANPPQPPSGLTVPAT